MYATYFVRSRKYEVPFYAIYYFLSLRYIYFPYYSVLKSTSSRYQALRFEDTTFHIFYMKAWPCNTALYLSSLIFLKIYTPYKTLVESIRLMHH
jgi:hypothetical protein